MKVYNLCTINIKYYFDIIEKFCAEYFIKLAKKSPKE